MKFKVNKSKEAIADGGSMNFIGKSGIYDVVIDFASLAVSSGGAESVNFNIDYNGKKQTVWGPYVQSKQGKEIAIGANLINKLAIIAGEDDQLTTSEESFPVGKDQEEKEFTIIDQFSDLPVKMRVQEEYSFYKGQIKQKMVIKAFFREDGASAEEIVNDSEIGVALLKEQKYADHITYAPSSKGANDAPTPEEVAEWAANGYGKGNSSSSTTAKTVAPKKAMFGKK